MDRQRGGVCVCEVCDRFAIADRWPQPHRHLRTVGSPFKRKDDVGWIIAYRCGLCYAYWQFLLTTVDRFGGFRLGPRLIR